MHNKWGDLHKNKYNKAYVPINTKRNMTYILGARCTDGVVLVGDTKVTLDGGADYAHSKKIFRPFASVVMGASGLSGLYKSFQDRMIVAVQNFESQKINVAQPEKLSMIAEQVIRDMHNIYNEDRYLITNNLNVLMAIRTGEVAELRVFTGHGFPEPVNTIKVIGHGEPYGAIFLKKIWKPTMSMKQTAKLALFVLKILKEAHLDESVGFNDDYLPQVFYIPDIEYPENFTEKSETMTDEEFAEALNQLYDAHPIKELSDKEVNHVLNEVSFQKASFDSFFSDGQFRI